MGLKGGRLFRRDLPRRWSTLNAWNVVLRQYSYLDLCFLKLHESFTHGSWESLNNFINVLLFFKFCKYPVLL